MQVPSSENILPAANAAPTIGPPRAPRSVRRTYQAQVDGTGALTATIEIYVSNTDPVNNVGTNGLLLGTITLAGTTTATDGFTINAPWKWTWAKLTAISGTGAAVNVTLGVL